MVRPGLCAPDPNPGSQASVLVLSKAEAEEQPFSIEPRKPQPLEFDESHLGRFLNRCASVRFYSPAVKAGLLNPTNQGPAERNRASVVKGLGG